MSDDQLATQRDERGVATVTLCRPDKHNAFDDALIAALQATFEELAADATVRIVVLASEGKSFSAGADLGWMKRMAGYSHEQNLADARALAAMLQALNTLPQPTIARVQGAAFGGAVGLVACCDLAVGSSLARFCLSETRIGLIPATISPYVIQAIGSRAARRYFLTAESFDAERALALNLLSAVAAPEDLDASVNGFIDTLLGNGPDALGAAKRLVLDYSNRVIDAALVEDSCERIATIRVAGEGQAGLAAFLDKQPMPWNRHDV